MAHQVMKAALTGALAWQGGGDLDGSGNNRVGNGDDGGHSACVVLAPVTMSTTRTTTAPMKEDAASSSNKNKNSNTAPSDRTTCELFPHCPGSRVIEQTYHAPEQCSTHNKRPSRPIGGDGTRHTTYQRLKDSGLGATRVPNQHTVTCPGSNVQSLENEDADVGFDTSWLVENTRAQPVVVARMIRGIPWSPYTDDRLALEDPMALVQPHEWISIPTYESYVYHVYALEETENGGSGLGLGDVLLQHRVGLIPLGNKETAYECGGAKVEGTKGGGTARHEDVQPYSDVLEQQQEEFGRPTTKSRHCNVMDLGFRNEAGCPLSVYWANMLGREDLNGAEATATTSLGLPEVGFTCAEQYKFHLGTLPTTQDFMWDWNSSTKYEGSFIGHTFIARLANDPTHTVIDTYTVTPTKIIECPTQKQKSGLTMTLLNEVRQDIGIPHHDTTDEHDDDDNAWHQSSIHPAASSLVLSESCMAASTVRPPPSREP